MQLSKSIDRIVIFNELFLARTECISYAYGHHTTRISKKIFNTNLAQLSFLMLGGPFPKWGHCVQPGNGDKRTSARYLFMPAFSNPLLYPMNGETTSQSSQRPHECAILKGWLFQLDVLALNLPNENRVKPAEMTARDLRRVTVCVITWLTC